MFKTVITAIALTVAATSASAVSISCIANDMSTQINMTGSWLEITDAASGDVYKFENKGIEHHNGNLFINMDENGEGAIAFMNYDTKGFSQGAFTFDGFTTYTELTCNK